MSAFDAIIGYEGIKENLYRTADCLRNTDEYFGLGVHPPRALLLYGEPGVGKSLMARCLIEESGRTAYVCRKDAPNGTFVENIKNVFTEAMHNAPSIVFLDDLDKFANTDRIRRDAEEYVSVQSCIDALGDAEVFVLATANDIEKLPDSLLRQGRLGNRLSIPCPKGEDAEKIINHYLKNKRSIVDVDASFLARLLGGRSCAELEGVINEAGLIAGYRRDNRITMDDMVHAALSLLFGASDQVGDACDEGTQGRQEQIAYHEAGHVVVGEVLDPGCTTLATVLKCNNKDGGFTLGKRSELLDYPNALEINIIVGLGGKAAVEQRLGLMDIGALDDTKKVADKIERLVCEAACYGASLRRIRYLSSSEALDNNVEQVIAAEFERYYLKAKEVLAKNMGLLEAVATCLLEKKIITLHDIEKLKCEHPIVPVLR